MKNILILNAHQHYPFAPGRLNASLVERMIVHLRAKGYTVQVTTMQDAYQPEAEMEKHRWADTVIVQTPVYWMGVPWIFKKYMDEVYSAGVMGLLCDGDGRSSKAPKKNYGMGGKLTKTRYMLSLTFNAPKEAFDNPDEPFFAGKGVDDLFLPLHLTFKFFGMHPLPTFVCYDVIKAPAITEDFARLEAHLAAHFPAAG
ncbi:MAG: NAD(P)H-dependent oxidoreductase [Magnetococcales bacterium]|nr:NAD(P)H-dependent oxidoreductase [Magnetococcales bacterium]